MSVSWRDYDGQDEYHDTPYEAEIRAATRERMRDGWQPLEGWVRPTDPMCPAHGYGLVDGKCGVCLQRLADLEEIGREEATAELGVAYGSEVTTNVRERPREQSIAATLRREGGRDGR